MTDQADALRQLARELPETAHRGGPIPARARSLVLTSGKGGVGTSNLALNIAIELAVLGQRIVLIDGDLGRANLDLLCGLAPGCDLGDVLAGERAFREAIVEGPAGIRMIPGAHGMRHLMQALDDGPIRLLAELSELERGADYLIIDAGSGLGAAPRALAEAADSLLVVSTPEPTSLADVHAALSSWRQTVIPMSRCARPRAVINMARSRAEAIESLERLCNDSRSFGGIPLEPLGYVRHDARVGRAVRHRRPFVLEAPWSPATRCVRRLARAIVAADRPKPRRPGFFQLMARNRDRLDR